MPEDILIGLGGNLPSHLGAPYETIKRAIELLATGDIFVSDRSAVYKTAPVPVSDQPDFINMVIRAQTSLKPHALLELFQKIEVGCGRKPAERWSARTLDIDLLAYGASILPSSGEWRAVVEDKDPAAILSEPVVPHPRLHKRAFVLLPLMDIAPDWYHPYYKRTVSELVAEQLSKEDLTGVEKLSW